MARDGRRSGRAGACRLRTLNGWRSRLPGRARSGSPSSAARCPTSPASTCSATRAGASSTSARRSRSASGSPRTSRARRSTGRRAARRDRPHRVPRRPHRGRGAAHRAELHQAVPAAVQHPAARRQVVSVHRDLARRGLPARVLHARAPPPRARLLRPVLERQARARDARPARQGLPVPLLRGRRAGAPLAARRASTTTSSAAGRPASATSRKEEYREGIDGVIAFLSGRYREIERDLERRMHFAAGEQDYEQAAIERNRLQAVRSLLERQRVANEGVGHVRRGRASRSTAPRPTRRSSRCATACCRTARPSTSTTTASTTPRARRGGVPAPVLHERARDPAADRRAGGGRRGLGARACSASCWPSAAAATGRGARRRARRQAARSSSSPSATRGSRSTRRSSRPSAAASSASRRSTGSSRRSGSTRCRCGSSASTSPTSAARTPSPRWSCSRAARRRSPTTGASRSAPSRGPTTSPRWTRCSSRRYAQFELQHERSPYDADRDESFAALPNLIVIDGGKGQLSAGLRRCEGFRSRGVAVVSLAKRIEEVFLPGVREPLGSPTTRPELQLLQRVRDEAHRFAIAHHRIRRDKAMTESIMDELPGIGPARKRALLKRFGSPEGVLAASREELESVPGLPPKVARELYTHLNRTGERRATANERRGAPVAAARAHDLVIVSGMSGAGKSSAMNVFEDAGYFCVDNLPAEMIRSLAELFRHEGSKVERACVVADARGGGEYLESARAGDRRLPRRRPRPPHAVSRPRTRTTLLTRYKETRRRHPLAPTARSSTASASSDAAGADPRARRRRDRHDRPVGVDAAAQGRRRAARARGAGQARGHVRLLRAQARPAARRRPGVRRALPARTRTTSRSCAR